MKLSAILLASALILSGSMHGMEQKEKTMSDYACELRKNSKVVQSALDAKNRKRDLSIIATMVCCCPCITFGVILDKICPTNNQSTQNRNQ